MTKKSDASLIFIILETPNSFTFPLIATLRAGIRAEWTTRQSGI